MPLHFRDELPHFRASFLILKTQSKIRPVWLRPNNQCLLLSLIYILRADPAAQDLLVSSLRLDDEPCFVELAIKLSAAKRGASIRPSGTNKFIKLRKICETEPILEVNRGRGKKKPSI